MSSYCTRTWLNPPSSFYTGSVACYAGKTSWGDHDIRLEVADCSAKALLHGDYDTPENLEAFRNKLDLLISDLEKFREHLAGLEPEPIVDEEKEE